MTQKEQEALDKLYLRLGISSESSNKDKISALEKELGGKRFYHTHALTEEQEEEIELCCLEDEYLMREGLFEGDYATF